MLQVLFYVLFCCAFALSFHRSPEVVVPNGAVHGRRGVQGPAWPDRVVLQHGQQSQNHQGENCVWMSCPGRAHVLGLLAFPSHPRHLWIHANSQIILLCVLRRYVTFFILFSSMWNWSCPNCMLRKTRCFISKVFVPLGCLLMRPRLKKTTQTSASNIKKVYLTDRT